MAKLAAFAFLFWITAIFVAGWIHALRTGRASLIGPFVGVNRGTRPVSYVVFMTLLLLPVVSGLLASIGMATITFPLEHVPAPPAAGYAHGLRLKDPERADTAISYFPATLKQMTYNCGNHPKPMPILSDMANSWYSKHLAAAGEPSLLKAANQVATGRDVYRFTWLRSFDKPIFIRIEEAESGAMSMTASRLSGAGGYEPGRVEARMVRRLSRNEAQRFRRALAGANGLRLKAVACGRGYDGAQWIFEGVDRHRYRYVERWTPKQGRVRALGLVMLSFTGWNADPIY